MKADAGDHALPVSVPTRSVRGRERYRLAAHAGVGVVEGVGSGVVDKGRVGGVSMRTRWLPASMKMMDPSGLTATPLGQLIKVSFPRRPSLLNVCQELVPISVDTIPEEVTSRTTLLKLEQSATRTSSFGSTVSPNGL